MRGSAGKTGRRMWAVLAIAAVIFIATGLVIGGRFRSRPAPVVAHGFNLLLITLDTTRADHLGAYGFARARTRHLDRLAAEGVRFEHAFSPAPLTLPAHASIFTGLYPPEHGVRNNGNFYLSDRVETLTTILHGQGYRTAAFVSSFILDRRYGLGRGFDTYDDQLGSRDTQVVALEAERRGDRTALALSRWLDQQARNQTAAPFFAWLHLYDPHEPYQPPPPFRDAFQDAPYDGEIAFDDAIVASVVDTLGRVGLLEKTIIAIISDHGESLGEHGEETHSMFVYDGAIRVPLILWRPGVLPAGRVVTAPISSISLAPTLLELLGAPPLRTPHGRSLVPLIQGTSMTETPAIYAETLLPQFYMNWAPLRAIRDERWKLIDAPRPELYDLQQDPGELQNRYADRPQTAGALRQQLQRVTGGAAGAMNVGTVDRETVEKLASLGYVGAGAAPSLSGEPSRTDPKDVIAIFNRLRRANSAVRDRRFDEALPILRQVLADDPRNAFATLVLGSAYLGMERYAPAIEQYRRYLALVPASASAHHWMAICHLRLREQDAALREAQAALAIDPHFGDARVLIAGVLASRGDYVSAVAQLRTAIETDPAKAMIRLDLAKVLAEAGQRAEAEAEYEAVLKLQPGDGAALTGLGVLYATDGRLDRAEATLRQVVTARPDNDEARFNLARVHVQQGRRDEARAEYRALASAANTSPAIRAAAQQQLLALGR